MSRCRPIWIVQGILTLGFTVLIAAIGVLIRDVQHLMGVVLMFWFYLTPIFYELKQMPAAARAGLPQSDDTIVTAHRAVTLYGQFPNWTALGGWRWWGAVVLVVEPAALPNARGRIHRRGISSPAAMNHLIINREYPPCSYPPGGIGTYVDHISRLLARMGKPCT